MHTLPLQLRPSTKPLPVAAAWLHHADARRWLQEIRQVVDALRASAPQCISQIEAYATPRSRNDRQAGGLVIVLPRNAPSIPNPFSQDTLLLGWANDRVLAPCHARIFPTLDPTEIALLFPYACHFLHPTEGLIGFEEEDRINPASLVSSPVVTGEDWNCALPPTPVPPRLNRLVLVIPSDLDDLIDEMAGDIGKSRKDPSKNKEGGPIKRAGEVLGGLGAGMIGGMAAGLRKLFGSSGQGSSNNWLDKIAKWGAQQWKELQDAREREVQKLLKRFESDPDEALRHALPLAGDESRGVAPPSTKLGPRDMRLNLDGSGRGGPADNWNLDNNTRAALERRYREAAEQAMRDGKFERAAYIYGELLGDWAKAANALKVGGRPRDAAKIYLERLSNKSLAAKCLEEAGLLWDAIALYREMAQHENAGDLLTRLSQLEEAQTEYRTAIEQTPDILQKARILEKKCMAPDEALALLNAAWPLTGRACECLQAQLELLGRLERHTEATQIIRSLEFSPFPSRRNLLDTMLKIGANYPHPQVRREIEPVAITIIGTELSREDLPSTEHTLLLQRLPKFVPEDRLLERDALRFKPPQRVAPPTQSKDHHSILQPSSILPLGLAAKWQSLSWGAHCLSLAGIKSGKLAVGSLVGNEIPRLTEQGFPVLPANIASIRHVLAGAQGGARARIFHDPAGRKVYFHSLSYAPASSPLDALRDVLAICASGPDEWALMRVAETSGILVEYYDVNSAHRRSLLVDYASADALANAHLAARKRSVWIGVDKALCWHPADEVFKTIQLDAAISSLSLAPEIFGEQAIVTAEDQVTLVSVSNAKRHEIETVNLLGGTSARAVACFTNHGCAVVLNEDGGLLYDVKSGVREKARIAWPPANGRPIAIAPFGDTGFAVLAENQTLLTYRA